MVDSNKTYHTITPSQAERLQQKLRTSESLEDLSRAFQLLSDPTRLQILYLLHENELCVHDLSRLLDRSQSAVSHQLRTLRQQSLVERRRDGRVVYYSLSDDHVIAFVEDMLEHLNEDNA